MIAKALPGAALAVIGALYAGLLLAAPTLAGIATSAPAASDDSPLLHDTYTLIVDAPFALGIAATAVLVGLGWIVAMRRARSQAAFAWGGAGAHLVGSAMLVAPPIPFFLTPQRYPTADAVWEAALTWANAFLIVGSTLIAIGLVLLGVALFGKKTAA